MTFAELDVYADRAAWDDTRELLAAVVDRLGEVVWLTRKAHFKGEPPPPVPVPRPGDGGAPEVAWMASPPRMSSAAEIRSFFGAPDGGTESRYTPAGEG